MSFVTKLMFIGVATVPVVAFAQVKPEWAVASAIVAPKPAVSAPQLVVSQVIFTGNSVFSQDVLQSVIAPDLGKQMTLDDIRGLADQVKSHYHQSGYRLANVVVPKQRFESGKPVELVITEGWLDRVEVSGNQRYASRRVMNALSAHSVSSGTAFKFNDLERALTRLNRQSGITTAATLKAGDELGATTLAVSVTEAPRVRGAVEINNYGSKNTGEVRIIPSIEVPNATGRGDVFSMLALKSLSGEGTFFGRMAYEIPLGHKGYRLSAFYSQGNSSVGGDFSTLDVRGDNKSIGVGVLKEFIRSPQRVDVFDAWLESHDIKQEVLGLTTSDDRVRKLRLGYTRENSAAKHRTVISTQLHQGLGAVLGGMKNNSVLSSRSVSGADNQFTKLTVELSRLQRLNARTLIIPRATLQVSSDPLVVGEQISIGGFYSVAGHAPSAHSGDSGIVLNLEGRYAARPNDDRVQYFARLDHGRVLVNKTFIGQRRQEDLSGAAIGITANPWRNISFRLEYAKPIGDRTEDGQYVYAQARYQF